VTSTLVPITQEWSIQLAPGFERRAQGGDLVLWDGSRTVYASVFETSNADAEAAIAALLKQRHESPAKTFDRVEPGLAGHAFLLPEHTGGGTYWGLNTWTAARGSVACVTFYFDRPDDLAWALSAWQSLHCGPCERYVN
jgi:hypothetical protein